MNTFNQLNAIITLLHQYAFQIGISIATLMITVYSIVLMFDTDQSPAGRNERYKKLRQAFFGAFLIAAAGGIIAASTGLGGRLIG